MISEPSAAIKDASGAPISEWPWIIRYAIDWHNAMIGEASRLLNCRRAIKSRLTIKQRITHRVDVDHGCEAAAVMAVVARQESVFSMKHFLNAINESR